MISTSLRPSKKRPQGRWFRLKPGYGQPVFLGSEKLAQMGRHCVEVWSTASRKCELRVKTIPNACCFAYSLEHQWVATKNSSGELGFSSFSDGELYLRTKRPPYQDASALATWKDGIHLIDTSLEGHVYVHNAQTGEIVTRTTVGYAWMTVGVQVRHRTGTIWAGYTPKAGNPRWSKDCGLWRFPWPVSIGTAVELILPNELAGFSLDPAGKQMAVVIQSPDSRLLLRIIDLEGQTLREVAFRGEHVYGSSLAWSPTGDELAVPVSNEIVFFDADSLEMKGRVSGPKLVGIAYDPDSDLVAIAGEDGGIVAPRSELERWSEEEGKPAAELSQAKYEAYCRRTELRRASPPRAAVIRIPEGFIVEAERSVADFHYFPQEDRETLPVDCLPADLGRAARRALARFKPNPYWPIRDKSLSRDQFNKVRKMGYESPFIVNATLPASHVSITLSGGLLDLWPSLNYGSGEFGETDWPRMTLPEESPEEELGTAILRALDLGTAVSKKPRHRVL